MSKEKNFISAVVYAGEDKKSLKNFLRFLDRSLSRKFEKYEIICAVDGNINTHKKTIDSFARECHCRER